MKIIYIAHPVGGDVDANLGKIASIVRILNLNSQEIIPFTPYYADCVALDDDNEMHRARGFKNNEEFFSRRIVDELWVFGKIISPGMQQEIEFARNAGIPVKFVQILADMQLLIKEQL